MDLACVGRCKYTIFRRKVTKRQCFESWIYWHLKMLYPRVHMLYVVWKDDHGRSGCLVDLTNNYVKLLGAVDINFSLLFSTEEDRNNSKERQLRNIFSFN